MYTTYLIVNSVTRIALDNYTLKAASYKVSKYNDMI